MKAVQICFDVMAVCTHNSLKVMLALLRLQLKAVYNTECTFMTTGFKMCCEREALNNLENK